jgi:hypothetical protein
MRWGVILNAAQVAVFPPLRALFSVEIPLHV